MFTSSLLNIKQHREKETSYQKLLIEQQAKKEAEETRKRKNYLTGKFNPVDRDDFVLIPSKYTTNGAIMYLRKETLNAYLQMEDSAKKDMVNLKIASATRDFIYQKGIWNNKWIGVTLVDGNNLSKSIPNGLERFQKILEYSAVPGTSRHHWGTDIDLNAATPEYFNTTEGRKVYGWLVANAPSFGFCQTYNLKGTTQQTGHNEEKWHWSYIPLARGFTEKYKNLMTNEDIKGFDGDEFVNNQDLINKYVLSINPDCI